MAITPASGWKKKNENEEITLPSGNVALLRRPGMEAFLQAGVIPNSLMGLVMAQVDEAESPGKAKADDPDPAEFMATFQQDPDKLSDLMLMMNSVTVMCVVEPEVLMPPSPMDRDPRDPLALYADEVELQDKFFIFSYAAGGTADLERFREGVAAGMVSVSPGEGPPSPS